MTLNMPSVFGKTDDDLKPRWQQSGSTILNYVEFTVSDETLVTVTAGKTLYITTVIFSDSDANTLVLIDNGAGGTQKAQMEIPAAIGGQQFDFNTPLEFKTDVYAATGNSCTVTIIGWEE